MLTVLTETDSAANQFLIELRDKDIQINKGRFRNNMKRLGFAMALKISENLEYSNMEVSTPLGVKSTRGLSNPPVLISIMRAGNAFLTGFQDVFDESDVGFIGAFRTSEGSDPNVAVNYRAVPVTEGRDVILIDPMLATGKSMMQSYQLIRESGKPGKVFFAAVVSSPEGVEYIRQNCKEEFEIFTGDLDDHLDENAYIYPGLGDAGDLSFGKKI